MSNSTRNSILRINEEKTIQLIQECEKEQCLWNTKLSGYPNKEDRLCAATIIAEKLNIPNFTAEHVTAKFKNIRNCYCQELKKMKADKRYKPKVFWFPFVDKFLKPHLQKIKDYQGWPKTNIKPTFGIKTEIEILSDEDQDWSADDSTQSEASCSNSTQLAKSYAELFLPTEAQEKQSEAKKHKLSEELNTSSENIKKRLSVGDNTDIAARVQANNAEIEKYKNLLVQEVTSQAPPQPVHPKGDCFDSFGVYIASLLRNLPPKRALLLQPQIIQLIVSSGVETLNDNVPGPSN